MDKKASERIKLSLDKYTDLLLKLDDMRTAITKVDMDNFHAAHEEMLYLLESVELLTSEELVD